ncbi:hypothetical protein Tsubulata_000475 [Turnera subulata]|uniref:Starch synthase, chloroplastic/amyloplastic n=1 Tax=Turnera subulata TaxID=218843 RepID=A0A9Q0GLH3_9ROSI|nr:hypothetical protein Tsubulata_000475 [Turnera subulata]
MATVTASQFVSRSAHVNSHGVGMLSAETKANNNLNMAQTAMRWSLSSGERLQSLIRTHHPKAATVATKAAKTVVYATESDRPDTNTEGIGMSLVFVATEVGPWSKTGGLGDVLGGLPPALAARGHRVMTIAPRYDQYKDAWDTCLLVKIKVGDRIETIRYFHCYKRGVDRVFVDHPWFLEKVWGKTGSKIYGPTAGEDYVDNQLRFSLFCLAALEAPRVLNLNTGKFSGPYGEDILFIANDWHTGPLPCYLKALYQPQGIYTKAKVAFCIHNVAYQGRFAFSDFSLLNLPDRFKSSFDFMDGYDKPVKGRKINWMKAGILEADQVITVSPYYAEELVSGADKGVELDSYIRARGILGIVNGMDGQEWNPATDKYIGINYDITTVLEAKPLVKEALQAEAGLPVDRNIPVIGFIGRLEEQKGSDILAEAIPMLAKYKVQIIILGTGKKYMEKQIAELEKLYPDKVRGVAAFNVPLAHMINAGADFMMIPSRFEPCGLIQLQAMRYGTACIVASTGGLVDTVKEGYTGFHMGAFSVECDVVDPADVAAIVETVERALGVYGTSAFVEMIKNCMSLELSWKGPAKAWEEMLLGLGVDGSEAGIDMEEKLPLAKENVATP